MNLKTGLKIIQGVFLFFLVGGFSLLLYFSGFSEDRVQEQDSRDWRTAEEDVRLGRVRFKEWKQGKLVWILDARKVKYYHNKEKAYFEEVDVVFLPPSGERMIIHADRVIYAMDQQELDAEGNVWGESDKGVQFYTNSLFYSMKQKEVETPAKVTLKKGRLTIEGTGMKGSLDDQTFVLLSSVKTVFYPGDGLH